MQPSCETVRQIFDWAKDVYLGHGGKNPSTIQIAPGKGIGLALAGGQKMPVLKKVLSVVFLFQTTFALATMRAEQNEVLKALKEINPVSLCSWLAEQVQSGQLVLSQDAGDHLLISAHLSKELEPFAIFLDTNRNILTINGKEIKVPAGSRLESPTASTDYPAGDRIPVFLEKSKVLVIGAQRIPLYLKKKLSRDDFSAPSSFENDVLILNTGEELSVTRVSEIKIADPNTTTSYPAVLRETALSAVVDSKEILFFSGPSKIATPHIKRVQKAIEANSREPLPVLIFLHEYFSEALGELVQKKTWHQNSESKYTGAVLGWATAENIIRLSYSRNIQAITVGTPDPKAKAGKKRTLHLRKPHSPWTIACNLHALGYEITEVDERYNSIKVILDPEFENAFFAGSDLIEEITN